MNEPEIVIVKPKRAYRAGREPYPVPSRDSLLQSYTVSKSIIVTAAAFKVSYETMRRWLKKYEIPRNVPYKNNLINSPMKGRKHSRDNRERIAMGMRKKLREDEEKNKIGLKNALDLLLSQNKVDYGDDPL